MQDMPPGSNYSFLLSSDFSEDLVSFELDQTRKAVPCGLNKMDHSKNKQDYRSHRLIVYILFFSDRCNKYRYKAGAY